MVRQTDDHPAALPAYGMLPEAVSVGTVCFAHLGRSAADTDAAMLDETMTEDVYEASRCLQCGLCLEVCPNFDPDADFTGAAGAVPATRILTAAGTAAGRGTEAAADIWKKRVFAGCGKSLSCQDICPAGIPTGAMLAQSNAVALWGRRRKGVHRK